MIVVTKEYIEENIVKPLIKEGYTITPSISYNYIQYRVKNDRDQSTSFRLEENRYENYMTFNYSNTRIKKAKVMMDKIIAEINQIKTKANIESMKKDITERFQEFITHMGYKPEEYNVYGGNHNRIEFTIQGRYFLPELIDTSYSYNDINIIFRGDSSTEYNLVVEDIDVKKLILIKNRIEELSDGWPMALL